MFRAHHTMVTDNFYKATPYYVGLCNIAHAVYGDPTEATAGCKRRLW